MNFFASSCAKAPPPASEMAVLDELAGANGSDQDDDLKREIWAAGQARKVPARAEPGSAIASPALVAASGNGLWPRAGRWASRALLPAALALLMAFQALPSGLESSSQDSGMLDSGTQAIQIASRDPANAMAIARRVMGAQAHEDVAMEAQLARALGKYEGLPNLAALTVWRSAGEPAPTASSMSIPLKGGECSLAMLTRADGSRAGGTKAEADKSDALYKGWSHLQQQEIDALHEMGHCLHYANQARFSSTLLGATENDMLNQSIFSWQVPGGMDGDASIPASLFSENFADAFSALKWMEARGFSKDSKQLLSTLAQERAQNRMGREVSEAHPDGTFNPHFTEFAVIRMVQSADALKAMSPAERLEFAQSAASDASLAVLAKMRSVAESATEATDPAAMASRAALGALSARLALALPAASAPNESAPVREGSPYDAAMAQLRQAASARLDELMAKNGVGPDMLARAAQGKSEPKAEALLQKAVLDPQLISKAQTLFKGIHGFDSQATQDAFAKGIKAARASGMAFAKTGLDARQAALGPALSVPGAPKLAAYRGAKARPASAPAAQASTAPGRGL